MKLEEKTSWIASTLIALGLHGGAMFVLVDQMNATVSKKPETEITILALPALAANENLNPTKIQSAQPEEVVDQVQPVEMARLAPEQSKSNTLDVINDAEKADIADQPATLANVEPDIKTSNPSLPSLTANEDLNPTRIQSSRPDEIASQPEPVVPARLAPEPTGSNALVAVDDAREVDVANQPAPLASVEPETIKSTPSLPSLAANEEFNPTRIQSSKPEEKASQPEPVLSARLAPEPTGSNALVAVDDARDVDVANQPAPLARVEPEPSANQPVTIEAEQPEAIQETDEIETVEPGKAQSISPISETILPSADAGKNVSAKKNNAKSLASPETEKASVIEATDEVVSNSADYSQNPSSQARFEKPDQSRKKISAPVETEPERVSQPSEPASPLTASVPAVRQTVDVSEPQIVEPSTDTQTPQPVQSSEQARPASQERTVVPATASSGQKSALTQKPVPLKAAPKITASLKAQKAEKRLGARTTANKANKPAPTLFAPRNISPRKTAPRLAQRRKVASVSPRITAKPAIAPERKATITRRKSDVVTRNTTIRKAPTAIVRATPGAKEPSKISRAKVIAKSNQRPKKTETRYAAVTRPQRIIPKIRNIAPPTREEKLGRMRRFLETRKAGNCFVALPGTVKNGEVGLFGFARTSGFWPGFLGELVDETKLKVPAKFATITDAQCMVVSFAKQSRSYPDFSVSIALVNDAFANGDFLEGVVKNVNGRTLNLFLVDDEGIAQRLNGLLFNKGSNPQFSFPVSSTSGPVATAQLLLAVVTSEELRSAAIYEPLPVAELLFDLQREIIEQGLTIDLAITGFTVN